MQPLINRLDCSIVTCDFLDLSMDNPETSSSKFSTISPILLHFLISAFRRYISRVSDVALKEFGFEFNHITKSD